MKQVITILSVAAALAAGCSGAGTVGEAESAPYKAVVVFHWADAAGQRAPSSAQRPQSGGGGPEETAPAKAPATSPPGPGEVARARAEVEQSILAGLTESRVFSDLVPAGWDSMQAVARKEKADLIVLVRIGSFCRWDDAETQVVLGLATVGTALWAGTGIGSWWIADHEFSTHSEVEVSWRRPDPPDVALAISPDPSDRKAVQAEFRYREPLSSGEYRLSLWDRARPWRYPWAYLLSIVCPPALLPIQDRGQVDSSLRGYVLSDLHRELARKLKGGYLRSSGAPFLFRLEAPVNGATIEGDSARLSFRYRTEAGFEEHEATGLSSLVVGLRGPQEAVYRKVREYRGAGVRALNAKIARDEPIDLPVTGLEPGLNFIRFEARTEQGKQWITNTVAIRRR